VKTGSGTILAGNFVTFAGDTNKYLVTTGVAAIGDTMTIAAPGIMTSGAIADAAVITLQTSNSTLNAAYHRDAIQLLARAPKMPLNADGSAADQASDVMMIVDPKSGLVFQLAEYKLYRQVKYELGLAWGAALVKPAHASVLLG
jgi:hypothetical protein